MGFLVCGFDTSGKKMVKVESSGEEIVGVSEVKLVKGSEDPNLETIEMKIAVRVEDGFFDVKFPQ